MTILKSNGTWCVQGRTSLIGTGGLVPVQQFVTPQSRDNFNPAPGQAKNEVQPLECVLLYWAIKLTVNAGSSTPDPFVTFTLLRNSVSPIATIDFPPQTIGTKAQLLNIPIFVNEHFNFKIQQFGSGNTFWTWMAAGKLSAPPI